jgi:glyoxylase-like metal-dependent hydrolase (beta-lactamase superfamily II)
VISAATAGAVFGLDGPIEFLGSAFAQSNQALIDKGFVKFKIGDIEVTQIYDGIWNRELQEGFVRNAPMADLQAALAAAGAPEKIVPIPFTVTAVTMGGKTTMIDSGTGNQVQATAGLLLQKNLAAADINAASVENVVVSHFHPDHIFGLMAKDTNAPLFPKAAIHVSVPELAYWTGSSLPQAAQGLGNRVKATLGTWSSVQKFEGDKEVLPGIRSLAAPGHTPGHTSYHLASGGQQLIVLGDITNIPALFAKNPGWHGVFDTDGALAEATRRKMMDRIIADKVTVAGYHYGMPGAGTIAKDGNGYVFTPIAAELTERCCPTIQAPPLGGASFLQSVRTFALRVARSRHLASRS